jgi:hypothetical protein
VHDIALVQVVKPLEDLDHVARDKPLVELPKSFQSLPERTVLRVSK